MLKARKFLPLVDEPFLHRSTKYFESLVRASTTGSDSNQEFIEYFRFTKFYSVPPSFFQLVDTMPSNEKITYLINLQVIVVTNLFNTCKLNVLQLNQELQKFISSNNAIFDQNIYSQLS